MASESSLKTVGDYVTLQRGNTYSGKLVGQDGPALLGLGSIEPGGGFRRDHYKTFGGECPTKIMVPPGGIYVALKGATKDGSMVGSVARLPKDIESGRLTQDTARLDFRNAGEKTQSHIYWTLRTPQYRDYCAGRLTGSAAASFSREDFLSFPVPPISDTTEALVEIFESIESKIDVNRRMNETLEGLARVIFKSWFVDFDPVRAKAGGRNPFGLKAEVAALFPSGFRRSELGEIPVGWQMEPLSSVAEILMGASPDGSTYNSVGTGMPLINGPVEFGPYHPTRMKWTTAPTRLSEPGDLILCVRGSTTGRSVISNGVYCLGRGVCSIRPRRSERAFVVLTVRTHLQRLLAFAVGSVFPNLSANDISSLSVVTATPGLRKAFSCFADLLFDRVESNVAESTTLASIRDLLLPELLSGALRIRDAEKVVEAHV